MLFLCEKSQILELELFRTNLMCRLSLQACILQQQLPKQNKQRRSFKAKD